MRDFLKKILEKVEDLQTEERSLRRFMGQLPSRENPRVLDVGCGYGRNIRLLKGLGYDVLGVETNEDIVRSNEAADLHCVTPAAFAMTSELYDVVLMSHVIEHFNPGDLLHFMEQYLQRLKPEGYLIITTPLLSPYFYDDFDHIRPYTPVGIELVFGRRDAQVQYHSINNIELVDLWFRRSPIKFVNFKGRYLGGQYALRLCNALSTVLFRATFHRFGRCDGWMGLYKKTTH